MFSPTLSHHCSFLLLLVFRQSGVHQHALLVRQASVSASSGLWGKKALMFKEAKLLPEEGPQIRTSVCSKKVCF